jgi:hypothetical protein
MNNEAIYSLAYVSRSEIQKNVEDLESEIGRILESSRLNNRLARITGALLFSEGWFAQILEGPQEAIETLFETVQGDSRHSNVTISHFHSVPERSFPAWSMAYAGLDSDWREQVPALRSISSPEEIAVQPSGHAFISVLRDYIKRQELGLPENQVHLQK